MAISIGGSKSGAIYNPAVTVAVFIGGKYYKRIKFALFYMLA